MSDETPLVDPDEVPAQPAPARPGTITEGPDPSPLDEYARRGIPPIVNDQGRVARRDRIENWPEVKLTADWLERSTRGITQERLASLDAYTSRWADRIQAAKELDEPGPVAPDAAPNVNLADPDADKDARTDQALKTLFGFVDDPDQHQRVLKLSRATRVDPNVVEEALPEFEAAAKRAAFDPALFRQKHPHLVELFLSKPATAQTAVHDQKLSVFDEAINTIWGNKKAFNDWIGGSHSFATGMADLDARYSKSWEILSKEKAGLLPAGSHRAYIDELNEKARLLKEARSKPDQPGGPVEQETMPQAGMSPLQKVFGKTTGKVPDQTIEQLEQGTGPVPEHLPGVASQVFSDTMAQHRVAALYGEKYRAIAAQAVGIGNGPTWELEKQIVAAENEAGGAKWYGDDNLTLVLKDVGNLLPSQINTWGYGAAGYGGARATLYGIRKAAQLSGLGRAVPPAAWKVADKAAGQLGLWGGGWMGSFNLEYGSYAQDARDMKTDAGEPVDPVLIALGGYAYAAGAATIEVGVEFGAMRKLYAPLAQLASKEAFREALDSLLKDPTKATFRKMLMDAGKAHFKAAAAEAGEEAIQQTWQDVVGYIGRVAQAKGQIQIANPAQTVVDAGEAARSAAVGVMVGHAPGAAAHFQVAKYNRDAAAKSKATAAAIAAGATGPTADQDPTFFEQVVAASTARYGEPVTDFYVDPGPGFLAMFQDEKATQAGVISPEASQAARELLGEDGPTRLRDAVATGSRLRISIAEYAERFAGRPMGEAIMAHVATKPWVATPAQEAAFEALVEQQKEEVLKKIEAAPDDPEVKPLIRFRDELKATKRANGEAIHTPDQVQAIVQAATEWSIRMADHEGVKLSQWLAQNEVTVRDVFTKSRVGNETDAIQVATSGDAVLNRAIASGKYADTLTPLGNAAALADFLSRPRKGVYVFVDLDGLKHINDTYGHGHADGVITQVGTMLSENSRAALGKGFHRSGDEFVFHFNTRAQAEAFLLKSRLAAAQLPALPMGERIGMSMGVGGTVESADKAMYATKGKRKREPTEEHKTFLRKTREEQDREIQLAEERGATDQAAFMREAQEVGQPKEAVDWTWDAAGIEDLPDIIRLHQGVDVAKAYFDALRGRAQATMDELLDKHGEDALSMEEYRTAKDQFQTAVEYQRIHQLQGRPMFRGRPIWSGVVSLLDGTVEQAFTYQQARDADFHHSMLVNYASKEKLDAGEAAYFWIEDDGTIRSWEAKVWPAHVLAALKQQIQVMGLNVLEQAGRYVPKRASQAAILAGEARIRQVLDPKRIEARVKQAVAEARRAGREKASEKNFEGFKPEGDFSEALIALAKDLPEDLRPKTEAEWELFAEESSNSIEAFAHQFVGRVEQGPKGSLKVVDGENEGRPTSLQELKPRERLVVFKMLARLSDGAAVYDRLQKFAGTSWAKMAIQTALARAGMEQLMAGEIPDFDSPAMHPSAKVEVLRNALFGKGKEGLLAFIQAKGMISHPEKPGNAVNGSFLNCAPSPGCAGYCYATGGPGSWADNLTLSEARVMALELYPQEAAKIIADEYRGLDDSRAGKALRFFDKGDISLEYIPVLEYLVGEDVRAHVFSRRPEILRLVPDFHLKLQSVDESNRAEFVENPVAPGAYVYNGTDEDAAWLNAHADLIGVILPVSVGRGFQPKSSYAKLLPVLQPTLCPVDVGNVALGTKFFVQDQTGRTVDVYKKREDAEKRAAFLGGKVVVPKTQNWRCARCDAGGGVGCYYGRTSAEVRDSAATPSLARFMEVRNELSALARTDPGLAAELSEELAALIRAKRQGALDGRPGEIVPEASPSPQPHGGGAGEAGSGSGDRGQEAQGAPGRPLGLRILEQSGQPVPIPPLGPEWYSVAERAVVGHKQEKGTGDSWLAILSKAPGVKAEELDWIWGLREFLKSKKSFTRDEVATYIRGHQLRIEEWLGGEDYDRALTQAVEEAEFFLSGYGVEVEHNHPEEPILYSMTVEDPHGGDRVDVFNFWSSGETNAKGHFVGDLEDLRNALRNYSLYLSGKIDLWNEVTQALVDQTHDTTEEREAAEELQGKLWNEAIEDYPIGKEIVDAAQDFEDKLRRSWLASESDENLWEEYTAGGSMGPGAPKTQGETYRVIGIYASSNGERVANDYEAHTFGRHAAGLIGWARVSETILPDGRRALIVHEIQTDLHANARDKVIDARKEMKQWQEDLKGREAERDDAIRDYQRRVAERDVEPLSAEDEKTWQATIERSKSTVEAVKRRIAGYQRLIETGGYRDPEADKQAAAARQELNRLIFQFKATLEAALGDDTDKGIRTLLDRTEEGKAVDTKFGRKFYRNIAERVNRVIAKAPTNPWGQASIGLAEDYWMVTGSRAMQEQLDILSSHLYSGLENALPHTPWKGDAFYDLMVRRTIRYAAERGIDTITWMTGENMAQMFKVSHVVDRVRYDPLQERLQAYQGTTQKVNQIVPKDELHKWMGRDVAEKLLATPQEDHDYLVPGETSLTAARPWRFVGHQLVGDQLNIGGQGMGVYYDQKIPALYRKYLGKDAVDREVVGIGRRKEKDWDPFEAGYIMEDWGENSWIVWDPQGIQHDFQSRSSAMVWLKEQAPESGNLITGWTAKIPEAVRDRSLAEGMPLFQENEQGEGRGWMQMIQQDTKRVFEIVLKPTADASTVMHELGHVFLEVLAEMADRPLNMAGKPMAASVRADFAKALTYMGVKDKAELYQRFHDAGAIREKAFRDGQRALTAAERAEVNRLVAPFEKWARAFEAYLMEGKAPSMRLEGSFQSFKLWLRQTYQSIEALGAPLNDEIRGVFDRLVATDAAIENQAGRMGYETLARTPSEAGMTPEQFAAHLKRGEAAMRSSILAAQAAGMKARLTSTKRWWREQLDARTEEYLKAFRQLPAARAWAFLKKGDAGGNAALQLLLDASKAVLAGAKAGELLGDERARIKALEKKIAAIEGKRRTGDLARGNPLGPLSLIQKVVAIQAPRKRANEFDLRPAPFLDEWFPGMDLDPSWKLVEVSLPEWLPLEEYLRDQEAWDWVWRTRVGMTAPEGIQRVALYYTRKALSRENLQQGQHEFQLAELVSWRFGKAGDSDAKKERVYERLRNWLALPEDKRSEDPLPNTVINKLLTRRMEKSAAEWFEAARGDRVNGVWPWIREVSEAEANKPKSPEDLELEADKAKVAEFRAERQAIIDAALARKIEAQKPRVLLDYSGVAELVGRKAKTVFRTVTGASTPANPLLTPRTLAELLGVDDPKALLDAMAELPDPEKWAKDKAQADMLAAYPEIEAERSQLEEKVGLALNSDARLTWLLHELMVLRVRLSRDVGQRLDDLDAGSAGVAAEAFRRAALDIVAGHRIGSLEAGYYLNLSQQASEKAIRAAAKGAYEQAYVLRQQQLLNLYIYRAVVDAKDDREAGQDVVADLKQKDHRARMGKINPAYRDALDTIMERMELAGPFPRTDVPRVGIEVVLGSPQPTGEVDDQGQPLMAWRPGLLELDGGTVLFDLPMVMEFLQNPPEKKGTQPIWKSLTVAQYRELVRALKNIKGAAVARETVQVGTKKAAFEDAKVDLLAALRENLPKRPVPGTPDAETFWGQFKSGASGIDAELLKLQTVMRWMDGGDPNGPWTQTFIRPMQLAKQREADLRKAVVFPLIEAMDKVPKKMRKRFFEEVDGKLLFPDHRTDLQPPQRRFELLVMALHAGSESSLKRLLVGRNITYQQLLNALSLLTEEEMGWVQNVWNTMSTRAVENGKTLWELARDLEERDSGLVPEKVEARSFEVEHTLPNGETVTRRYAGGYFPAVYERLVSSIGELQAREASLSGKILGMLDTEFSRPFTNHQYLRKRSSSFTDALSLSPEIVQAHLEKVIHDIAFREVVKSTAHLLYDEEVKAGLQQFLGKEREGVFYRWLKDIGSMRGAELINRAIRSNRVIRGARARMAIGVLGYAADIVIGDTSNIAVHAVLSPAAAKFLPGAIADSMDPVVAAQVEKESGEIRFRRNEVKERFNVVMQTFTRRKFPGSDLFHAYVDHGWAFFDAFDRHVAMPVYLAEKRATLAKLQEQGIVGEEAERQAIEAGEVMLQRIFPSHHAVDTAEIMRDRGFVGSMMLFFGYFNLLYNERRSMLHESYLAVNQGDIEGRQAFTKKQIAATMARTTWRMLALVVAAHVLGEWLTGRGYEPEREEPEDWWIRKILVGMTIGDLPFGGYAEPFVSGFASWATTGEWVSRQASVRAAPGLAAAQAMMRALQRAAHSDGDYGSAVLEVGKALGLTFGFPIRPLRGAEYFYDLATGGANEVRPPYALDVASGAIYGEHPNQGTNPLKDAQDLIEKAGGR